MRDSAQEVLTSPLKIPENVQTPERLMPHSLKSIRVYQMLTNEGEKHGMEKGKLYWCLSWPPSEVPSDWEGKFLQFNFGGVSIYSREAGVDHVLGHTPYFL
jgi:hypothetical protein